MVICIFFNPHKNNTCDRLNSTVDKSKSKKYKIAFRCWRIRKEWNWTGPLRNRYLNDEKLMSKNINEKHLKALLHFQLLCKRAVIYSVTFILRIFDISFGTLNNDCYRANIVWQLLYFATLPSGQLIKTGKVKVNFEHWRKPENRN